METAQLLELHIFTHPEFIIPIIAETPEKALQLALSDRLKHRFACGQVLDAISLEHAIAAARIRLLNAQHSIYPLSEASNFPTETQNLKPKLFQKSYQIGNRIFSEKLPPRSAELF